MNSNQATANQDELIAVLEAFATQAHWQATSDNRSKRFTLTADPASLAQAALNGDTELIKTLLTGESLDSFTRELNELVSVQQASQYRAGWVLNQLFEVFPEATLTRDQWVLLGHKLDYQPGWAFQQYRKFGSDQQTK